MASITNEKIAVYLSCKASGDTSAKFYRLGEGINTFTPSNNGQISTKHYINHKFATSRRNGLQKQWAFSGDRVPENVVNDYLFGLSEKTGADVETKLLIVDLTTGTGTSSITYTAKQYNCMIDLSNDGTIEGGADVSIDGTIYANGDPVLGTASITVATSSSEEFAEFTATT